MILLILQKSDNSSWTGQLAERLRARGCAVRLAARTAVPDVLAGEALFVGLPPAGPWLLRRLLGRPYRLILAGVEPAALRRRSPGAWWVRLRYRGARRIVCLNAGARNALVKLGIPRARLALAAPPVEPAPAPGPPAGGTPTLAAGLAHGHAVLVPMLLRVLDLVLERCPAVSLRISGDAAAVAAAESRAEELGLSAHVQLGVPPGPGSIALVLHTGSAPPDVEFALRAAAAGLPIAGMRHDRLDDWLKDGEAARMAAPRDELALADAIARLLGHPAEAARLGEAARARIEARHSWDNLLDELLA